MAHRRGSLSYLAHAQTATERIDVVRATLCWLRAERLGFGRVPHTLGAYI